MAQCYRDNAARGRTAGENHYSDDGDATRDLSASAYVTSNLFAGAAVVILALVGADREAAYSDARSLRWEVVAAFADPDSAAAAVRRKQAQGC